MLVGRKGVTQEKNVRKTIKKKKCVVQDTNEGV